MDKYNVLIIGAGNIASDFDKPNDTSVLTHAHAFSQDKRFNLLGFVDVDRDKGEKAAEKWNCNYYEDIKSIKDNVDVVCCCVPDRFHKEVLINISELAPLLVVAEKPITLNASDLALVYNKYHKNIPMLVNYSRRFIKEFEELKSLIADSGKLLKGTGYYGKGLVHNGTHMIDLIRLLLGEVKINSTVGCQIDDYLEEDLTKDLVLSCQNALVYLQGIDSRCATIFELELFFEKRRIRILEGGYIIEIYDVMESSIYKGYYNYRFSKKIDVDYSKAMIRMVDNVYGFLNGKEDIKCSLDDGVRALEIAFIR